MDNAVTRQLESELATLKARLEEMEIFKDIQALERVIRRQRGEPQRPTAVQTKERQAGAGRQESSTSIAMKDAAEQILQLSADPITTKDLVDAVVESGIYVPGDNPQNNLSAHLSRDSRFLSLGREGWVLASAVKAQDEAMESISAQYVDRLSENDINVLDQAFSRSDDIPTNVDRNILHEARVALKRNLVESEKSVLRRAVRDAVERRRLI